ncbi:MAG: Fur family transcriptional regulator [Pyrobaculum sp.]|jgi:Fur family peroxide stress response transcriptional regulator|uniref:Fur family transcriptional regulator n=1 Tax=Pyrobaculum sp. TaxID=2004705 RepID=UPI003CA261C0
MESTQVVQVLRDRGYRVTPQRIEVINIVLEKLAKREHPTFNDILNEVKQKMPSISASTVYSILRLLEDSGLVVSFEHNGRTYYDSVSPHINVVCVNSDKVIDIVDDSIVNLLRERGVQPLAITVKALCAGQ